MQTFMQPALPAAPTASRDLACRLITDTLRAAGKQFSESPRTPAQIDAYADAMTDMFCAYLRARNGG
jgi:hypothetical protein